MKKLLLLFAFLIFACSSDNSSDNNNSNQSNYFFEFELFDVVNRVQGDYNSFYSVGGTSVNNCISGAAPPLGWNTTISIGDISATNYISGQNFYFGFMISDPQIGNDNYTSSIILLGDYIQQISPNLYFSEIEGDFFGSDTNNKLTNITITDLGEVGSLSDDMQDFIPGDSFKATYEKTVYFASQNTNGPGFVLNIPTLMRFEINSIRGL